MRWPARWGKTARLWVNRIKPAAVHDGLDVTKKPPALPGGFSLGQESC